ncbi:NAD(P)-dependent oxidoreductase [Oceanicoccus sp. KOV_DT_Chl]|uniref:NAD-dependent epimerase/dehydratase family protein n=1 Tax=Oceanicoccus sp. KOV_DT_Chl TaxID=1904639 RepID=UPI000C7E0A14|nr:SDR family NAD(P)-dependent oxidoreductase [Oceanicoccus sp. KOV_DT_Chl]
MKVLVTGGTGFVGSHVARQLLASGHDVCLLVRSVEKAQRYYAQFDIAAPSYIQGDITDKLSVEKALLGCEAVVHAAAGTPINIDSVDALFAINVGGVKNVVAAALAQGVTRIVCISSITAIFNTDGSKVTADAEPVPSKMPYGQSKVEAEWYLRQLQAEGKPIAIVYPGGIIGPEDPGFSDTFKALKHRVENGFRLFDDGGMQHVDVRDLAALINSLIVDGGSGRFLIPGVYRSWVQLADIVESVSGCTLQRIPAKGWKLRLIGSITDVLRKFKTIDTPISAETMRYATLWPNINNTEELNKRNIDLRDPEQTFADAMQWMVHAGHLDAGLCPKL